MSFGGKISAVHFKYFVIFFFGVVMLSSKQKKKSRRIRWELSFVPFTHFIQSFVIQLVLFKVQGVCI
jgi:hypothetical protein